MDFQRTSWLVALGAFLSSCLLLYECSKLDGYKFPVWTTNSCPRNETEWDDRSSFFKCNYESSYACLPNENFTELLEFCYPFQVISIQKGFCLYLPKVKSKVDAYNCSHFQQGCPTEHYRGSTVYKYPSCVSLGRGCFLQEPSCKRFEALCFFMLHCVTKIFNLHTTELQERRRIHQIGERLTKNVTETPFQGTSSDELSTNSSVWVMIFAPLLTIIFISVVATLLFLFFRRRKLQLRENNDEENSGGIEQQPFLGPNADPNSEEIPIYMKNNPDTASSTSKLGGATEPGQEGI
uniref:Uncharacterized protein LOC111115175 isoform X3 n=1 Tax=Crassostrea virginica TaxID=6565 RepID=A0A8B8C370_CRAVI|nr:uncharacterized protein LOC111115175 isoform X3 [Crassostrea virginica]